MPRTHLIAQQIARLPGGADVLLARHSADHLGHCRECSLPQAGPVRWPCTLVAVARLVKAHDGQAPKPWRGGC